MADFLSMSVTGIKEAERDFRKLGIEVRPAIDAGLTEVGEQIVGEAKELVPVDLGTLRASGHFQIKRTQRSVDMVAAFGGPAAPYALVMHEGRLPGGKFPPKEAVVSWAGTKLGLSPDEAERAWFPIARKIALVGTRAFKYLEIPFKKWAPKAPDIIAKHIRKMLARL